MQYDQGPAVLEANKPELLWENANVDTADFSAQSVTFAAKGYRLFLFAFRIGNSNVVNDNRMTTIMVTPQITRDYTVVGVRTSDNVIGKRDFSISLTSDQLTVVYGTAYFNNHESTTSWMKPYRVYGIY